MGFDGKERPVEFIKGESEAHAFTNASGRAANHAADSRHSNAPVVGKALQIAPTVVAAGTMNSFSDEIL